MVGAKPRHRIGQRAGVALAALAFAAVLVGAAPLHEVTAGGSPGSQSGVVADGGAIGPRVSLALAVPALDRPTTFAHQAAEPDPGPPLSRFTVKVKSGDSLSRILSELGVGQSALPALLDSGPHAKMLRRLRPGQLLDFELDEDKRIHSLVYHVDKLETLAVSRSGTTFASVLSEEATERREAVASGYIKSSLFLAGQRAGLSDALIMEMVGILGWDIDFALDIREGDRFTVVYETHYTDGEKVKDGQILAVDFVNQGRSVRAVRYVDGEGRADYYSPDGRSMRKAFLRTPVKFSRISSRFNLRRWHPILHKIRAHRGVDYAAPSGTPIKVTGNGRVTFVGSKGGYGKTVIVQHGGKYTTLYGHLRGFAKGIRRGSRVRQGQLIGYVGRTGRATGPHLHYEFRVNGVHRNPLTVRLPEAAPIPTKYRNDFDEAIRPLTAQLDLLSRTQLAFATP